MALRIKSRWHQDGRERSIDEIAGAIGYIGWRLAKDKAINLHGEDFVYEDDRQRMDVILEYLVFALQLTDRLAHQRFGLSDDERRELINASARAMSAHVQDNAEDLFGPGNYVAPFIERVNSRTVDYADFGYTADGPSYPMLRQLGYQIQQIMGDTGENRWVIDQVMDRDGWDLDREMKRALDNLFG